MQVFEPDYIDRLNRTYKSGKWIKAVEVTENPVGPVKKYFADHEESITFDGQTYTPLHMRWDGIKTSQGMLIQGAQISLSNLGNQVTKYLKTLDISGNEVILRFLHLDLLSTLTQYWQRRMKILSYSSDVKSATFTVGRHLGRNRLPRRLILKDRYKGLSSDVARIL